MRRFRGIQTAAACALTLLAACGKDAGKPRSPRPVASPASDEPALLATIPGDAGPPARPAPSRLGLHAVPLAVDQEFVFAERGGGVAFVVERGGKFQVVHNGLAGRPYAAVGRPAVSADGRRCAHGALVDGRWLMVVDGREGEPFSTVSAPVFSPDGAHVAYQAMAGEMWHLVVDGKVDRGTRTRFLDHQFAAGGRIVFIDDADDRGTGRLVVSDLALEKQTAVATGVTHMVLNAGGTVVAAVVTGEVERVLTFGVDRSEKVEKGPAFQAVLGVTFGSDGISVAYVGHRFGRSYVVLGDAEASLPSGEVVGTLAIRPDGKGVGALVADGGSVRSMAFLGGGGQVGAAYDEAEGLVYSEDGGSNAYAARRGASWFVVANGKEGPPFDRVVTPAWSPDGKFLVYRARSEGKRFVVVSDAYGKTVRQHAAHEQVYPVRFTAGGKSVAYGVKDGRQLLWKVEPL